MCESHCEDNHLKCFLVLRAAEPEKPSQRTIKVDGQDRVVAEKRASDGAAFVSPAKRYKRDRKRIVVDNFALALSLLYVYSIIIIIRTLI